MADLSNTSISWILLSKLRRRSYPRKYYYKPDDDFDFDKFLAICGKGGEHNELENKRRCLGSKKKAHGTEQPHASNEGQSSASGMDKQTYMPHSGGVKAPPSSLFLICQLLTSKSPTVTRSPLKQG
jgi:hypothetical protein